MAPYRLSLLASMMGLVAVALTACGGGGGTGSNSQNQGPFTVTCWNGTVYTSTVSLEDASAKMTASCPVQPVAGTPDLVISVSAPVYTGAYPQEKTAVFNLLNDDRAKCGFGKVAQNTKLDTAAQGHATYQAVNAVVTHEQTPGKPEFTGVTGSARMQAAGYDFASGWEVTNSLMWGPGAAGNSTNNAVSLTELSATHSLKYFYASIYHLMGAMALSRDVGIGVDSRLTTVGGTLNIKPLVIQFATSIGSTTQALGDKGIATFPCEGISGVHPIFGPEEPKPFPSVDMNMTPYGQPVYVMSGVGTTIALTAGSFTLRGGAAVPTTTLTADNDPQKWLQPNQVFLVPTKRLADNSTYDVALEGTSSGLISNANPQGRWSRNFSFTTATLQSE